MNDFFHFDLERHVWNCLSTNTKADGGPGLVFDHELAFDLLRNKLYLFGGRGRPTDRDPGIFCYDCDSREWTNIPIGGSETSKKWGPRSRHAVVVDTPSRKTYIFGGKRNMNNRLAEYVDDVYQFNFDTHEFEEVMVHTGKAGGALPGFLYDATIDTSEGIVLVMQSGLYNDEVTAHLSLWTYDLKHSKWACVFKSGDDMGDGEVPCHRYAHQLVYDPNSKIHYVHGGNGGHSAVRLDDFWALHLRHCTKEEIVRECRFILRKQAFMEKCRSGDTMEALRYLRSGVAEVVDTSNEEEMREFSDLSSLIFNQKEEANQEGKTNYFEERTLVFDRLMQYFPAEAKEPTSSLTDLVVPVL